MAYRLRMISTVKYGQFGAYFGTLKRLVQINDARGWVPIRVLVPTVGTNNEVVFEMEYPDLATLQRENEAFYADSEAFEAFRAGAEFIIDGSSRSELLEDVPTEFPGSE
jgi:hypothetical protein